MARLGHNTLYNIKNRILKDLYGTQETDFDLRRIEIAEANRILVMEPLQSIIAQLPENLFARSSRYQLFISYKLDITDLSQGVCEVWEYDSTDSHDINPAYRHAYSNGKRHLHEYPGNLDIRLGPRAAELCEEIMVLNAEKRKMEEFIDTTTKQYSGSLQLRKVWPESLHKYLPTEATKSKTKIIKATAPDFLNARLTNNLIEGN